MNRPSSGDTVLNFSELGMVSLELPYELQQRAASRWTVSFLKVSLETMRTKEAWERMALG